MYSPELEELIEAIIADGAISEKERSALHRRAMAEGFDPDELDIIIENRLNLKKQSSINVQQKIPGSIPPIPNSLTSSKYGTLKKCPNCGEVVKPGTAICSSCGLEFSGIGAVNSVERFSEKIAEIEKQYPLIGNENRDEISPRASAITSVIANFPIPNSKEDLLEFIVFTESKFLHLNNSTESEVAILRAYKAKYIESVEKAKIYFRNDPQFDSIFSKYEKNKKRKWRELNPAPRFLIIAGCSLICFLGLIFFLIFIAEANNW